MYCLDSTFIMDYLNKKINLTDQLRTILSSKLYITPFSLFELYYGIYKLKTKNPNFNFERREKEILSFTNKFQLINYTKAAAIKSAEILNRLETSGKIIEIVDIMIASTAIVHQCTTILTRNEDHFKRIKELHTQSYELI